MCTKLYACLITCLVLGFLAPAWAFAAADLTITSGAPIVTPGSVARGETVTLPSWTMRNQGTTAASNFRVDIYLSTDTVITTSDTYLDGEFINEMAGGAELTRTPRALTIHLNTAPGTYYVGIFIDDVNSVAESNETNNTVVSQQITVTAPGPELWISSGSPTVSPGSVAPGETVTLPAWTLRNQGGSITSYFRTGIYLSTDSAITTADISLGDQHHLMGMLGVSEIVQGQRTLTIPAGTAPGTYYVGILADADNAVAESNESNNTVVSQQITVTALHALPAPGLSSVINGVNVTLSWTSVPGATGYTLSFAPFPYTGPHTVTEVDMRNMTAFNASLWDGAAFYVAIKAYNDEGSSDYSNIALVEIDLPAPDPPVLSHTLTGNRLHVTWTSVQGATGYTLYYAPHPFGGNQTFSPLEMGNTTQFSIDLWSGAAYYLKVEAYNGNERSDFSNVVLFFVN